MSGPRLPAAFLTRPLAHRALHDTARGRPENSRAATEAAMRAGYGIEVDLQLSRDGEAMVFHDDALDRLTAATGPVRAHDAVELGRLILTHGSEGIPTLAELLALVAGRGPVLLELKDQSGCMGPGPDTLERATARALRGYAGDVAVMSFNPHSVAALARLIPAIPRGITTSAYRAEDWPDLPAAVRDRLRGVPDHAATGASFISHEAADLAAPVVMRLRRAGADILCWTIRSAAEERAARRYAANITFEGYAPRIPA